MLHRALRQVLALWNRRNARMAFDNGAAHAAQGKFNCETDTHRTTAGDQYLRGLRWR
jgi:hypothetical protein